MVALNVIVALPAVLVEKTFRPGNQSPLGAKAVSIVQTPGTNAFVQPSAPLRVKKVIDEPAADAIPNRIDAASKTNTPVLIPLRPVIDVISL